MQYNIELDWKKKYNINEINYLTGNKDCTSTIATSKNIGVNSIRIRLIIRVISFQIWSFTSEIWAIKSA